jgi:hypothetical protein
MMKSWDVDKEDDDVDWEGDCPPAKSKFEKFAVEAMEELEKNGVADLLLLKNDNLRGWWKSHKEAEARKLAERLENERIARVREEALAKLSTEERKVLGISTGTRRTRTRKSSSDQWAVSMDTHGGITMVTPEILERMWNGEEDEGLT